MVCRVAPKTDTPTRGMGNDSQHHTQVQEVADYETALDAAGYGRFSRSVLGACALAFFTTGIQNCVMSYALPAARCELQLTTYQAGLINMAFMSGGVASAFFWGVVGDVFGRRNILSLTLLIDSAILLAQSTVSDYRMLLAARSINGFLIGAPSTLVFTYLSDLVGMRKRQLYLNITGMSFVAAWLILPAVAWVIIPYNISHRATHLPVYSWRLYVALLSVPGLVAGAWLLFLPESPRLLAATHRDQRALQLIAAIHKRNGGNGEFKIKKLIEENVFVVKTVNGDQSRTRALFVSVMKDLKMFVSRAYAVKSSLVLFVFFANMAAGFGLNLWIPELLLRMKTKDCSSAKLALPQKDRLFNATNTLWKDIRQLYPGTDLDSHNGIAPGVHDVREGYAKCEQHIDDAVFTSGLIVGSICVLGNAACAFLCAKGGARGVQRAAAACALACALACIALAFCVCACTNSNKMAVAAAAALNAASLNGNVLLIRLLLNALPPKLSGLGVCWGAWWGRAGGVLSNLAVGVLLDYSCPAPFLAVAALLTISIGGIMMIKLEEGKNIKEDKTEECTEKNAGLDRYITTHM